MLGKNASLIVLTHTNVLYFFNQAAVENSYEESIYFLLIALISSDLYIHLLIAGFDIIEQEAFLIENIER